jgi:hypothetical protein
MADCACAECRGKVTMDSDAAMSNFLMMRMMPPLERGDAGGARVATGRNCLSRHHVILLRDV